jgi:hypothetical protein
MKRKAWPCLATLNNGFCTKWTYHEICIANVMLDESSAQNYHTAVFSIHGHCIKGPQICMQSSKLEHDIESLIECNTL